MKLNSGAEFVARLGGVAARDVNVSDTSTLTTASSFDVLHGWAVRRQSDNSAYRIRVRLSASGATTLGVARQVGSSSTWLSGVTLPSALRSGQAFKSEVQVTGTSPVLIQARVWPSDATKPNWQLSYSDSGSSRIQSSGSVELRDYVQSAGSAVTISRDDLSVGATDAVTTPTPTPPPTTTPPPATDSGRGAAAIGSASYSIPSGAIFVDGSNGSDSNAGSQSSPLKNVRAALAKASSGKTVVIRAGVYHESVASTSTVTLQNYPGEAVWFDGSKAISNWTKSGTSWVTSGWNAKFSASMGGDSTFKSRFIGTNAMAANPDQVFVDGEALWQVNSSSAVTAGKFYVDSAAGTIRIGTDPTGKQVRASDLAQAIVLSGANSTVQGIGVRRYANGYELGGALRVGGTGGTVRNVVVEDTATVGLSLSGVSKTVDHVTVQRAGQLGFGATKADNSVVSNSIFDDNNTQDFKDAPVSGGVKITSARTITIKNNQANNNGNGSGIWFDSSSYNMTIVNNTANGNGKYGIEVEVSSKGIIANNVATNGGEAGIILFDAADFKVYNNEVGGTSLFGIKIAQDNRRQASLGTYPESRDSRVSGVDPTVTWVVKNIEVSNNVFGNGGSFQIYALDGKTNRAVDTWNLTINGNLFNLRVAKTDPTMVAWGQGDNKTLSRYESPAALASAKNSAWKNAQITSSKPIGSMGGDKITYASTAVAIPSDVASATGLASGAKLVGVH